VENLSDHRYHIYGINATLDAEIQAFLPDYKITFNTEVKPGQTVDFKSHLLLTDEDEYPKIPPIFLPTGLR
jgi:hypothetical protein